WGLAGAGCTYKEPPTPWQNGLDPNCIGGRAFPDVVANAGAKSDVYVNGDPSVISGTSISTPLWAAFATTWNNNNIANSRPKIGFLAPILYSLGQSFHASKNFYDITSGTNGLTPGPGFDEASGWGSPDVDKLANNLVDLEYLGATN